MKKVRKLLSMVLAVLMVTSMMAGCSSSAQDAASGTQAAATEGAAAATEAAAGVEDKIIKVGVVCAMTGGSAIYGEGAQNAIDMAVEEINASDSEYKIEIVNGGKIADDAKDAKQAMNAYNKVMADGPEALVGSFFSSVTLPMAEQAAKDGMLLLATGAEFLYYPCFLDTVPLLVSSARNAGFTGAIMGGDGWDGSDTTGLEDKFENCYFTNHYSSEDTAPAVVNFVEKFTEKYGTESLNACAALYYDAMYMLVKAAENGGGTDTASLVAGMKGMSFTGVGGDITLDEGGDAIKSIVFNTYVDGQVKWSETLDAEGNVVSSAE